VTERSRVHPPKQQNGKKRVRVEDNEDEDASDDSDVVMIAPKAAQAEKESSETEGEEEEQDDVDDDDSQKSDRSTIHFSNFSVAKRLPMCRFFFFRFILSYSPPLKFVGTDPQGFINHITRNTPSPPPSPSYAGQQYSGAIRTSLLSPSAYASPTSIPPNSFQNMNTGANASSMDWLSPHFSNVRHRIRNIDVPQPIAQTARKAKKKASVIFFWVYPILITLGLLALAIVVVLGFQVHTAPFCSSAGSWCSNANHGQERILNHCLFVCLID
jgi:hypothetical protein